MKTHNLIIILAFLLLLVNVSNAQSNADYKHPFSKRVQSVASLTFKTNSAQYSITDNYKHPVYEVRTIESKEQTPECCSAIRISTLSYPNYKHPLTKFSRKTCDLEFVCKEKLQLSCC